MVNKIIRFAIVACIASCTHVGTADAADLAVGITSDCANYSLQDNIALRVEIRNQGASPITLYGKLGWGELGGVTLKIAKMSGKTVQPKILDDDMIIPSTLSDRKYYATVFRNQFIGVSRNERAAALFPAPGQYKIWVEYLSPVPAASSLVKHAFWSREMGKVTSNVLVLTIRKISTSEAGRASEKRRQPESKARADSATKCDG